VSKKGNITTLPQKATSQHCRKRQHHNIAAKGNITTLPQKGNITTLPQKGNITTLPQKGNIATLCCDAYSRRQG
jgi:hypothetical protein